MADEEKEIITDDIKWNSPSDIEITIDKTSQEVTFENETETKVTVRIKPKGE